MEEFSRQINNYRLFCKLQQFTLQLSLINFQEQQLFQNKFDNTTLPQSINENVSNVQDLFVFLKEKVKRFKFNSERELTCYPYLSKGEKSISLELQRQILIGFEENQRYMNFFRLQFKRLNDSQKKCLKIIKQQKRRIDSLQAKKLKIKRMSLFKQNKSKISVQNGRRYRTEQKEEQKQSRLHQNRRKSGNKTRYSYKEEQDDMNQVQNIAIKNCYFHESISEQHNGQLYTIQTKKKKKSLVKPKFKKLFGQKYDFEVQKTCPYFDKFKIFFCDVQRINSTDSYQLYGKEALKKVKSYFCCHLKRLKYNNIIIGVITENLFKNKDSNSCIGCICYDGYYGIVINNGIQGQKQYQKPSEGNILRVSIDFEQRKIEWLIEIQVIAKVQIPEKMLNSKLFPYFELFDKGDAIVLNIEG